MRVLVESLRQNAGHVQYIRAATAVLGGLSAGILGLRGWISGFAWYALVSMVVSLLLCLKTQMNVQRYFSSSTAVWWEGVMGNAFSYLLFWTLGHGLVYVYV
jgi:hypothetical protein